MLAQTARVTQRIAQDVINAPRRRRDFDRHLVEAATWLERAHDITGDGGVSYGYSLNKGWAPSYSETSGYIANTFFRLAEYRGAAEYRERGLQLCRWLIKKQRADGSFTSSETGSPTVFDTGSALLGFVRSFQVSNEPELLEAACRAGDWLVAIADGNARWTRSTYLGAPHVYNTRTAWALLELEQIAPQSNPKRERIARANLDWALSQQHDGYFAHVSFREGEAAFTHNIAYAIRGLLEAGWILGDRKYTDSAERGARAMLRHLRDDGFLPGQIDENGVETAAYTCLTGNCQLALIWAKLYAIGGDEVFRRALDRVLDYVMSCQDIDTADPNVRGAIKGSDPIWGPYTPLTYPNWATKFFIDAMILRSEVEKLSSVKVLNCSFDPLTLDRCVDSVIETIRHGGRGYVCTVNVSILMQMREDEELRRFVNEARWIVADGQPLVWAARLAGTPIPERVTGVDLMESLCARAEQDGFGVYLFGATDEILAKTVETLLRKYPRLIISGTANGFFDWREAQRLASTVGESGAKLLFVGMGVPRQERFIDQNWDRLGVKVAVGVGGTFEVLAGLRKRAPPVVQRAGLEWAFRLAQEPRRLFPRYAVTNTQFVRLISADLLRTWLGVGRRG